jgi:hypothetical protein
VAIKAIGMHSPDLLDMIENCPESKTPAKGAETLVARIVSLLTERETPTRELVDCVRLLHKTRNTDVRSLIPILSGLSVFFCNFAPQDFEKINVMAAFI